MNEQEKKTYLEKYKQDKEKGVPFFPDIIFKDAVISLVVFLVLLSLAYFIGVPTESRANPNDTSYTPRPEWYFLFLFQLLKYFPGKLEVIGAMIIPGIFIILLIALPFIDRNPKRHFLNRPWASIAGLATFVGIIALTIAALMEAPPPQIAAIVDPAASLYAKNCANCHGPTIDVPTGVDLHTLIAEGKHEGMPAWGGDLSTDEIDMLAGFVSSPNGSALYTRECVGCHTSPVLAAGNPQEIQRVLEEGKTYPSHSELNIPNWGETLSPLEKNALMNFLAAPDGQRLFAVNCSGCHGAGVAFSGSEEELRDLISLGGQHLDMPAWRGTLVESDLNALATYVVDPEAYPAGATTFGRYCSSCHGDRVPTAPDKESALAIIERGGAHITMPVWGEILTPEQLDALVLYTLEASKGTGPELGGRLFSSNCAACHGVLGEGGPNPTRPGDIIAPISSSEYLKTRDDGTLRNIITQGQPDFGMSPFGSSFGGPLSDEEVTAIVAFIRSWEANPPGDNLAPPSATTEEAKPLTGAEIYTGLCAQCHGTSGEGGSGPAINSLDVLNRYEGQALFDLIDKGKESTPMIAWGEVFTSDQINEVVNFVRSLPLNTGLDKISPVSFSTQVLPILQANCGTCHGTGQTLGGWDATSYQSVMNTGANAPVVMAGDPYNSILLQRILGIQGDLMPPFGQLSFGDLQIIYAWILTGAPDN